MICKCGNRMKAIDTRHNINAGETYRKYKCPECQAVAYTVEDSVEESEYFMKKWDECSRWLKRNRED